MAPSEDPAGGVPGTFASVGAPIGPAALIVLSIPGALLIAGLWLGNPEALAARWVTPLLIAHVGVLFVCVRHLLVRAHAAPASVAENAPGPTVADPVQAVADPPPPAAPSPSGPSADGSQLRSAAHDFNNSMMTIRLSVELLRLDGSLSPNTMEVLEDLDGAATQAATLVREVMRGAAVGASGGDAPTAPAAATDAPPPTDAVPPTAAVAPTAEQGGQPAPAGWTVLLAEDERAVLHTMKHALESSGYTVLPASDAEEALGIARSHLGAIDLLCTDASMPGRPVRELVDEFRRLFPSQPVLICSGNLEDALEREGLTGAGLSYLAKPFSVNELLLTVRSAIRGPSAGQR